MKVRIYLMVLLVATTLSVGCGNNGTSTENSEGGINENISSMQGESEEKDSILNSEDEKEKTVSTDRIIADIKEADVFGVENIKVTDLEIIKRQTNLDDKEDIIFVSVKGETETASIVRNYKLLYVLYNEGWLLENSEKYEDKKYYDTTLPLYYLDEKTVEADLKDSINWDTMNYVPFVCSESSFSDVTAGYKDERRAIYTQEILLEYPLFSRTIKYEVEYCFEDFSWKQGIISLIFDDIVLKDTISGTWELYMEASHPMHVDSIMQINLEKENKNTCKYNFLWTSRIAGGYDQTFSGTRELDMVFDENGFLKHIVIGYDSGNGHIIITEDGIVFAPTISTNKYILEKKN